MKDQKAKLPSMETSMGSHSLSPEDRAHASRSIEELSAIVEDILFFQWDPIGVGCLYDGFAHEYSTYVPEIVARLADGHRPAAIAKRLYELELDIYEYRASRWRCDVVAAMLCHFGPQPSQRNTNFWRYGDAKDDILKAALKIAIQARIQMYLNAWGNAAHLYQELNAWLAQNLPDLHALRSASLNNLGVALGMDGQLSAATECFEGAKKMNDLSTPSTYADVMAHVDVLENLINVLEYSERFDTVQSYYDALIATLMRSERNDADYILDVRSRMVISKFRDPNDVPLSLRPLQINGDGPPVIGWNTVMVD